MWLCEGAPICLFSIQPEQGSNYYALSWVTFHAGPVASLTFLYFAVSDRQVARLTRARIILTWAAAILAVVIVNWTPWGRYQTTPSAGPLWAVGVFLVAPLMGMTSVLAAMRLSAKMTDPQSANQFTGLVIVPTFMLGIGVFGKVLTISMAAVNRVTK